MIVGFALSGAVQAVVSYEAHGAAARQSLAATLFGIDCAGSVNDISCPLLPNAAGLASPNAAKCRSGESGPCGRCWRGLLPLLENFHFYIDLDFVANDEFIVGQHVEFHTEILAVDLAFCAVRDAVPHHLIIDFAVPLDLKSNGFGRALDRQVTNQRKLTGAGRLDPSAPKRNRWVLV